MQDRAALQAALQKEINDEVRALRKRIGGNALALRRERRLPLAKMAHLSGLCADTIDRLELGKDEIALDHLVRMARALGVDAGRFLADK